VNDSLAKLAYDEAVRAIDAQADVLDNLRARAGTLIAVSSLVTAFLGGQALAKPTLSSGQLVEQDIETWGFVAIGAFVAVAVMALLILWPYTWKFVMSPNTILGSKGSVNYEEALETLAIYHEENYDDNKGTIDLLFWFFRFGCGFLVVETIAWIVDLSGW
jgi:hypothetical protein